MGDILADNNRLDKAIQQYLMVISIDPHFGAHANLGVVYARQGRFAEAMKEVQTGREDDSDAGYRGLLAWVYAVS